MTNANTNAHPTDLALEQHLLAPDRSPLAPHVAACAACRARVARMEEEGERFRRFVYPVTVERIEAAARGRPARSARWWLSVLAPVAAAAAAAVAIVVVRSGGPGSDYVGLKGDEVALTAFARRGGVATPVADGAAVAPSEALRLRVRTSAPCRLFVFTVDARGSVSRLDGGGRDGLALEAGQHDLPGGVELDGSAGPERLFAVCGAPGLAWPEVDRAARPGAASAERVRAGTTVLGLPAGTAQATLLLEKTP